MSHFSESRQTILAATLATFLFLVPSSLLGQAVSGAVSGTVSDPSGASIALAKISAVNNATNVENTAATSTQGFYTLVHLVPGTYSLRVESPCFRRASIENV